jgi:3-hydroxymyristoyl/3-hydroxydecanoyl-(acyl carrier protein) dehydratase
VLDAVLEAGSGCRTASFRVRVPEDYVFFEGHFAGYPVLAGAVQLHEFVLPCLRRVHPAPFTLRGLSGLKFPRRIRPGDRVEVRLALTEGAPEVGFELLVDGERCTHGRLALAHGDHAGPDTASDAGPVVDAGSGAG